MKNSNVKGTARPPGEVFTNEHGNVEGAGASEGKSYLLVPLDGSVLAEAVLPHALLLARLLALDVTLLRIVQYQVVLSPLAWTPTTAELIHESCAQALDEARTYLAQIRAQAQAQGICVQTRVCEEEAPIAELICQAVRDPRVRLIAMATHGRSGLGRWLLGSVADEVLHAAPVPLLAVHPRDARGAPAGQPVAPYRVILVPLDGSALAEQALPWARRIAEGAQAKLVLVAVLPTAQTTEGGILPPARSPESGPAPAESVDAYLANIAGPLHAAGLQVETHVALGVPAPAILGLSAATGADLIVMATHGRRGIRRWRLGSVAAKVVQASPLPVLLVRPPNQEKRAVPG